MSTEIPRYISPVEAVPRMAWAGAKAVGPMVPTRYGGALLDVANVATGNNYGSSINPTSMGMWQRPLREAARLFNPASKYEGDNLVATGLNKLQGLLGKTRLAKFAPGVQEFSSGVSGTGNLMNYLAGTRAAKVPGLGKLFRLGQFLSEQAPGAAPVTAFKLKPGPSALLSAYGSYVAGDLARAGAMTLLGYSNPKEVATEQLISSPKQYPGAALANLAAPGDALMSYFSNDGRPNLATLVSPPAAVGGDWLRELLRGKLLDSARRARK